MLSTKYLRLGKVLKFSIIIICATLAILFIKLIQGFCIDTNSFYDINDKNDYLYNVLLNNDKRNLSWNLKMFMNNNRIKYYPISYFKRHFYTEFLSPDQLAYLNTDYPGKNGKGVEIPHSDNQSEPYWKEYHKYEFNVLASEKIPLNRQLPNKLMPKCYKLRYPLNLPKASIIIIFHNEANSTLLRTVHTAYTRSPLYLIEEIILVDDGSDLDKYPHLGDNLNEQVKIYPKVKVIRQKKRIGLTKAKVVGSKHAKGKVLVFLDSHCECVDGWLEPLLYAIHLNPRIAVTPVIDVIRFTDFGVGPQIIDYANIGVFNFKLDFNWKNIKMPDNMILKSPTMAGGLFAIDKEFFFKYGAYDEGMGFWGGENLEMSFRLWTCAEGIYINHCSVVGHVFRDKSPHLLPKNSVLINKLRVAEVWLDEFKQVFYNYFSYAKNLNFGDVSARIALRKQLNCKSFSWYLKNIATMIPIPDVNPYAKGSVTNVKFPSLCMDSFGKVGPLRLIKCHGLGGNQNFIYSHNNEIRSGDFCIDSIKNVVGNVVEISKCHNQKGNQQWYYRKNGLISKSNSFNDLCLEITKNSSNNEIVAILALCDGNNSAQIWSFSEYSHEIDNLFI